MPGVLTIDGTNYDVDERKANSLIVDAYCAWELERGGDSWLEFHEYAGGPQPRFPSQKPVEYRDGGGVLRFKGVTTLAQPGYDEGRTWGYRCVGLKYLMNQRQFTSSDFSGSIVFNEPYGDGDAIPSRQGKSIGEIVQAVIDMNAASLAAIGVSSDSTTEAQLAQLTRVPVDAVVISGQLADAMERVLFTYCGNVRMVILPTGLIRFVDAAALGEVGATAEAHTLTLGDDPIDVPLLRRDWSGCAPRVVARGQGDIRPFNGRQTSDELQPAWTDPQRLSWNDAAFTHPGDASDVGTVTTTGGPTSVTIQSSDGSRTWPANFWNKRQAWIHLKKATGIGLNYSVSVPVTACDAMTAGGTATVTLGVELENSASDAWDSYELIGTAAPLEDDDGDTGLNNVWRLFNVVTPGGFVEQHLVTSSPTPFPFYGLNNASVQLLNAPAALLVGSDGGAIPATFKIIPEKGQILFDEPIVRGFTSREDLAIGGAAVTPPADVLVLLLYSRGALETAYPPDVSGVPQYEGTSHTVAGMTNTRVEEVPSWGYIGNKAQMQALARMVHRSIKDVQIEGGVAYLDLYDDVLDPGDGHTLSFAGSCYTTGDESIALSVRSVVVRFGHQAGGPPTVTEMTLSNRVDWMTDPGMYTHSMTRLGGGPMMFSQLDGVFGVAAPNIDAGGFGGPFGWQGDPMAFTGGGPDASEINWQTGKDMRSSQPEKYVREKYQPDTTPSGGRGFAAREARKATEREAARARSRLSEASRRSSLRALRRHIDDED
ncbi:hypothetical protein [Paludisphaera rhizosphaerae]|uniref:hypothetical protein n=1 Tax=Paludisphaera rhizosphaerae TaxID=2711216 RepID=UPI0013E9DB43|nr:hypothetical protein [Paludisphaera rhizosphaerae]